MKIDEMDEIFEYENTLDKINRVILNIYEDVNNVNVEVHRLPDDIEEVRYSAVDHPHKYYIIVDAGLYERITFIVGPFEKGEKAMEYEKNKFKQLQKVSSFVVRGKTLIHSLKDMGFDYGSATKV